MWCIAPRQSSHFVCHMEDVLDVYHRPYDPKRPVICIDETLKQLIGEMRHAPLPPTRGRTQRYDSVYVRNGVASVFLAFEPLAGWRHITLTSTRTAIDWARFIKELLDSPRYAAAEKLVLVMDQLNTHSPASLYDAFEPQEARRVASRLEVHHTPKHGSWLNMAEIELSVLTRDLPQRVGDRMTLTDHVCAWEHRRNAANTRANWQFTTADARIKLRKLYPTIEA